MNPPLSRRRALPPVLVLATLALVLGACQPAPAAHKDRDGQDDKDSATLIISDVLVPGHGKTTMEFHHGDTLVRSTVHNYHNVPTKYRSIRGSFYPVYLVITGKAHKEPGAFQTVESILKALKQEGITILDDRTKAIPDADGRASVRTLKLRYRGRQAEVLRQQSSPR
jgi:hypothetical protein